MIKFVEILNDEGKVYDSYEHELWELVKLSGFETCKLGEIDYDSDDTYICYLRNGNTHANFNGKKHKCKLVLWLLEWAKWENGVLTGHELEDYWDEVWVSDRYYQRLLSAENNREVKYVFMGGHKDFGGKSSDEKLWDFCLLSYLCGTREHKVKILINNGYSVAPNCWGKEKEEVLAKSRWGLALQQQNTPFMAPQRLMLYASWELPILTDYIKDEFPYKTFPEGLIHYNPKDTICGRRENIQGAIEWNKHLCHTRTFKQSVEDAVGGREVK